MGDMNINNMNDDYVVCDYSDAIEDIKTKDVVVDGDLIKQLQSLVECPVCLATIRKVPVFCCTSGHVVCTDCRFQLTSCPVCRTIYPKIQLVSHVAAGIIDKIPHPCKFKLYGCDQSLKLPSLPSHESFCSYRLVNCPSIQCKLKISLTGLYTHMLVNGCASQHELKLSHSAVQSGTRTVLMSGRVKDVQELQYKVPLVFFYHDQVFVIVKKQAGDSVQFYGSIIGSAEQGRQYTISIAVFSEKLPANVVEYTGYANGIDGPLWYALCIHKDHMCQLLDQVEENEFNQKYKYHYKVKISRNV